MPCLIPNWFVVQKIENFKNPYEHNALLTITKGLYQEDWLVEQSNYSSIIKWAYYELVIK